LSFTGDPRVIEEGVVGRPATGWAGFSVSRIGSVAVQSGTTATVGNPRQPAWYDRSSKTIEPVGEPGIYLSVALSPDGKTVALERLNPQFATDIWLMDVNRGVPTRLTSHELWDQAPVWSPDGSEVLFFSNRAGPGDFYRKVPAGNEEVLVYKSDARKWPTSWSADGKLVMFEVRNANEWNLFAVSSSGKGEPVPFLTSRFNERQGTFSPDGQWVAYASDESGRYEIYIQSYPGAGSKVQVSAKGGSGPQWRHDGKELYFLQEGAITAADIAVEGGQIHLGDPHRVVDGLTFSQSSFGPNSNKEFDVARDGRRFFLLLLPKEKLSAPTTMILNWPAMAKKN
jgi:Tol biopolymer transport system component